MSRTHVRSKTHFLSPSSSRQKSGGYWRTGQVGSLSSYGKEAMHKAAMKQNNKVRKDVISIDLMQIKFFQSKKKVKVLRDEPVSKSFFTQLSLY